MPAESKLAKEFNVSRATLRAALGVLEREGSVRRERNIGCVRVRPPAVRSSLMARTIVLVSNLTVAEHGGLFGGGSESVMSGVIDGVGGEGFNFLRVSNFDGKDRWLDELLGARPIGVIVCWWKEPGQREWDVLERLAAAGLATVAFAHSAPHARCDCVGTNHQNGTEQLVRALAERGRRRILRMWPVPSDTSWIQAHDLGYERMVAELELECLPVIPVAGSLPRDAHSEANFRIRTRHFAGYLIEHLQGPDPIDAIMVSTDSEAMVALAACRLFGRPDIAVVGYDNYWRSMPEREWEPGKLFATVDKNNHHLGEAMVELLMRRLRGTLPPEPQQRLIAQKLVMTHTTSTGLAGRSECCFTS